MTPTPKEGPPTLRGIKVLAQNVLSYLRWQQRTVVSPDIDKYQKQIEKALGGLTDEALERDEKRRAALDHIFGELKANGHDCEKYHENSGVTQWCRMCEAIAQIDALTPTQEKE